MRTNIPSLAELKPSPDFSGRPRHMGTIQTVEVSGFSKLQLRPIRLSDEAKMVEFHQKISVKSIYMRYFEYMGLDRRTSHQRLVRICTNTSSHYSVVIEQPVRPHCLSHREAKILAVGRLSKDPEPSLATFDTLIGDEADVSKLSRILLKRLIRLAGGYSFRMLTGRLLDIDYEAIELCRSVGFITRNLDEEGQVSVALRLA
jgi:acetyltransferase